MNFQILLSLSFTLDYAMFKMVPVFLEFVCLLTVKDVLLVVISCWKRIINIVKV